MGSSNNGGVLAVVNSIYSLIIEDCSFFNASRGNKGGAIYKVFFLFFSFFYYECMFVIFIECPIYYRNIHRSFVCGAIHIQPMRCDLWWCYFYWTPGVNLLLLEIYIIFIRLLGNFILLYHFWWKHCHFRRWYLSQQLHHQL